MPDLSLAPISNSSSALPGTPDRPWCVDADTRDHVMARRNVLAGLWAGRKLGLDGDLLTDYAAGLHAADFTLPGDADVVETIRRDLAAAGISVTVQDIRRILDECHRRALLETQCTD